MSAAALPDGRLRRAVPADAARLALLGGATFLHAFAHDHPGDGLAAHVAAEHSAAWYAAALADPDKALWIVETPLAAPIGYAVLTPPLASAITRRGDLELKRLYVLGPWQGAGWGERLLDAAEREAWAGGGPAACCCASIRRTSARSVSIAGTASPTPAGRPKSWSAGCPSPISCSKSRCGRRYGSSCSSA